jgi:hypothetical protein
MYLSQILLLVQSGMYFQQIAAQFLPSFFIPRRIALSSSGLNFPES